MARKDGKLERMAGVSLFRGCSKKDLQHVARMADQVDFDEGQVLFREGTDGRDCYVLIDGDVEISIGGDHLATVGSGAAIGEMALLSRKPRVATATARTAGSAYVINGRALEPLLVEIPSLAVSLLRTLSDRLHELESDRNRLVLH